MFPDIGGSELIIVAIVALLVVKPKDLPMMMRRVGEFMGKARRMASDFRASFDDMARQSELDELRKEVEAMRSKASDPMGLTTALNETGAEIQAAFEPTSDPNFDYGFSPGDEVDNSIPWDGGNAGLEIVEKPKRKKAAPKKATATTSAAKPAPRKKAVKATVEGGPAPMATVEPAKRSRKRAS